MASRSTVRRPRAVRAARWPMHSLRRSLTMQLDGWREVPHAHIALYTHTVVYAQSVLWCAHVQRAGARALDSAAPTATPAAPQVIIMLITNGENAVSSFENGETASTEPETGAGASGG